MDTVQFNPSTLKASFNPATGKLIMKKPTCPCSNCPPGTVPDKTMNCAGIGDIAVPARLCAKLTGITRCIDQQIIPDKLVCLSWQAELESLGGPVQCFSTETDFDGNTVWVSYMTGGGWGRAGYVYDTTYVWFYRYLGVSCRSVTNTMGPGFCGSSYSIYGPGCTFSTINRQSCAYAGSMLICNPNNPQAGWWPLA